MADPMAALPIPPGHGLINTNLIRWKNLRLMFIEFLMKLSTSLQQYCSDVISDGQLRITKPDAHPQVVEPLPWHLCQAK